jgi:hypothetical protein
MVRLLLSATALLMLCAPLRAQLSEGGTPPSFVHGKLQPRARQAANAAPPAHVTLSIDFDVELLRAQDSANEAIGMPLSMARDIPVDLTMDNSGEWLTLANGQRIWQLTVEAPRAIATMLYYDELRLPPGGRLFIYNRQRTKVLGAYTEASNPAGGKFATELLEGDVFTLEYVAPDSGGEEQPRIRIEAVAYGYNNITLYPEVRQESYGDALGCQVNTACSEADGWRDQLKGVVRVSFRKANGNSSWCSGAIINNLRQDFTPYLLTAYHCVDESDSAALLQTMVYFHYEYASCGDAKANASEPTHRTLTGARLLATTPQSGGADGALLKLKQNIPSNYGVYYNGWSANGITPTSGVGIHHPRGDVKKISTFTAPASSGTFVTSSNTGVEHGHWLVNYVRTDNGYSRTESGSSGSSLFDQNKRIVGTLSGSNSSSYTCDKNEAGTAWYGKLFYHWDMHGSDSVKHHMKTYLDPDRSGQTTVNGTYSYTVTFSVTTAAGASIPDAAVTFNGVTNAAGVYTFSNIAAGTYNYTVAKSGYVTASGSFTVSAGTLTKAIALQPTPPPTYTVTFAITTAAGASIPDAAVTFNGVANAAGVYTFSNIAAGTYNYTVTKSGYVTASGSFTVSAGTLTKAVALQPTPPSPPSPPPTYTVTFAFTTDAGTPILDAAVTFNGVTNAAGDYTFSNIAAGTYNYTVTKSGYVTTNGSLAVEGDVVINEALYVYTGIVRDSKASEAAFAKLFPNPLFGGLLHVSLSESVPSVEVEVYTLTGELCLSQTFRTASFSIDISKCPAGALMVKIFGGGKYAVKAVMKIGK